MNPYVRLERQLVAALKSALAGGTPAVPEAGRLLWSIFVDLSSRRSNNGFGPNLIVRSEIGACRAPLQEHHIAILSAMDRAWMDHVSAQRARTDKGQQPLRTSDQPINPAAFDAVFGHG